MTMADDKRLVSGLVRHVADLHAFMEHAATLHPSAAGVVDQITLFLKKTES